MRPWTAVLNCNDLGWLLGVLVLSLCCLDHGFGIEPDILPSQRYCLLAGSAFCFDSPRAGAKEPFTSYSLQQICRGAWQPRHRSSLLTSERRQAGEVYCAKGWIVNFWQVWSRSCIFCYCLAGPSQSAEARDRGWRWPQAGTWMLSLWCMQLTVTVVSRLKSNEHCQHCTVLLWMEQIHHLRCAKLSK